MCLVFSWLNILCTCHDKRDTRLISYFNKIYVDKILADYECCVCGRRKTAKGGSGYEPLEKCETENGARSLHDAALSFDFPHLQSEVGNSEWQTILAKEYSYHRSCYREICKKRVVRPVVSSDADTVFRALTAFIEEKVIVGCEVFRMSDISRQYSEIAERLFGKERQIGFPQNYKGLKKRFKSALAQKLDSGVQSMVASIYSAIALKRGS